MCLLTTWCIVLIRLPPPNRTFGTKPAEDCRHLCFNVNGQEPSTFFPMFQCRQVVFDVPAQFDVNVQLFLAIGPTCFSRNLAQET